MTVTQAYGANIAFIEELYEKYQNDPQSVSASWREFFKDYTPPAEDEVEQEEQIEQRVAAVAGGASVATPVARPAPTPAPAPAAPRPTPVPPPASAGTPVALRGAASKIVANMESSL